MESGAFEEKEELVAEVEGEGDSSELQGSDPSREVGGEHRGHHLAEFLYLIGGIAVVGAVGKAVELLVFIVYYLLAGHRGERLVAYEVTSAADLAVGILLCLFIPVGLGFTFLRGLSLTMPASPFEIIYVEQCSYEYGDEKYDDGTRHFFISLKNSSQKRGKLLLTES